MTGTAETMIHELRFNCPLAHGIHARPASALEEVARNFGSEILLTNERTGRSANAKSVLAIISAEIRHNDTCHVSVKGADAVHALQTLGAFVRETLPRCDDGLPPLRPAQGEIPLPPSLRNTGARVRHGTPVVPGVGRGVIVQARVLSVSKSIIPNGTVDPDIEMAKLDSALAAVAAAYEDRLRRPGPRIELNLLKAHLSVTRDPEFRAYMHEAIRRRSCAAAAAVADAEEHFTAILGDSDSMLLRERTPDIRDVCFQLLRQAYGPQAVSEERRLTQDAIVVAEALTPEQFLSLDRRFVKGLVLAHGGTMSHTVILARSFGIPTVTGVADVTGARLEGQEAIVDGDFGVLVTGLTESARRYYELEGRRLAERLERERRFATLPAVTPDGHAVEIAANVATAQEAVAAFAAGAEGIGLFRTEMLFFDRDTPPGEDEQFAEYRRTIESAAGRTVIIRTVDLGGDKPLAYLNLPAEHNPFLGLRAVRIYPQFEALFRTQVRAIVRASAHGPVRLMIPMVATVEEALWTRRIIADEQARLDMRSVPFDRAMQIGAMIEVPAAAFILDALCRELDFFSIGSNDLLQGFAAVDRANPRLAPLFDPLQPSFLRLLKKIVDEVHAGGKWVGLCGEMGGQPNCLPLLVGLGLDEISAAPSALTALKAEMARSPVAACRELVQKAVTCDTAEGVRRLLDEFATGRPAHVIEPDMVILNSRSATKEEAIKEIVDRLYVMGRTEHPRAVEEALWRREAVYSTGFGHGFAIPHCKTNAVNASSIGVLKLLNPVQWGATDGNPVSVIILMAARESDAADTHMKIFSKLARLVMQEAFQERLMASDNPEELCSFLKQSLEL